MFKRRLLGIVFMMLLLVGCPPDVLREDAKDHRGIEKELAEMPSGLSLSGQYYALVIGINEYQHFVDLKTAVNDARAVADVLRKQYGFKTRLLENEKATRDGVLSALDALEKVVREQDHILIYYAGHGIYDEDSEAAYWLPHDSDKGNDIKWIMAARITKYLKRSAARNILVVADSCYSGVLEPDRRAAELMSRGNRARYLRKMLEKPARILISSGGNEPVRDTVRGGSHSIFAKVFIEGLTGISESVFTSDELFHSQKMRERVSGQVEQTPEFKMIRSSGHDGGDFVFRRVDRREEERAKKLAKIARLKADKSRYETSNVEDGELARLEAEAARLEAEVAASKERQQAIKSAQAAEKRRWRQKAETLRRKKEEESRREAALRMQKAETARQAELERAEEQAGSGFVKGKVFQDRLRDGSLGPKMVWIPAGRFKMGDIQGGGGSDEKPVHQVSVKRFAMGTHEITVGEFRRFVNATGYKMGGCTYLSGKNWRNPGFFQSDNHPVVCISWNDATAYAEWLTEQTNQQYRLPTEAEWEYSARADSTTKYWWGNNIGSNKANCDGCGSQWDDKSTAPVGSFQANPFGLYDTVGNVWELTCSEYESRYNGKEKQCLSNNRAKSEGRFAVRGGSWDNVARWARTASRSYGARTNRLRGGGFRLARI